MIEARHAVSIDTVLKQVQQLRAEAAAAPRRSAAAPSPAAAAPRRGRRARAVRPAAPAAAAAHARPPAAIWTQLWGKLVEAVGRASPFVQAYFMEAHPVSFAKNVLTIGFDPEFADHLPLVDNAKNHALLQTKLAELGHPQRPGEIRPGRGAAAAKQAPPAAPRVRACSGAGRARAAEAGRREPPRAKPAAGVAEQG